MVAFDDRLQIERALLPDGRALYSLRGLLDRQSCATLCRRLDAEPPSSRVVIDFSRLEAVSDVAIGAIAAHPLPFEVTFTGLRDHAKRILRAFGRAVAA